MIRVMCLFSVITLNFFAYMYCMYVAVMFSTCCSHELVYIHVHVILL